MGKHLEPRMGRKSRQPFFAPPGLPAKWLSTPGSLTRKPGSVTRGYAAFAPPGALEANACAIRDLRAQLHPISYRPFLVHLDPCCQRSVPWAVRTCQWLVRNG